MVKTGAWTGPDWDSRRYCNPGRIWFNRIRAFIGWLESMALLSRTNAKNGWLEQETEQIEEHKYGFVGCVTIILNRIGKKKNLTKTKLAACHESDFRYFFSLFKIKKKILYLFSLCFNHFHLVCQYLKMPLRLHLSRFIVSLYKERTGDGWVAY